MTTNWDHIDHDPTSLASIAVEQRPTVRLRHMSMSGGGFTDRPTGRTFHRVDDANTALVELAMNNDHAFGGVVIQPDPTSPLDAALHVVIHWGLVSERYHLDTITYTTSAQV